MKKRRIRTLKDPHYLTVYLSKRELSRLAKALNIGVGFFDDGSWDTSSYLDHRRLGAAAGMMVMDGLKAWKQREET